MAFGKGSSNAKRCHSFDLLATLIAVVKSDGAVLFANAALEDALGTSRRTLEGSQFGACFSEPQVLRTAIDGTSAHDFATLRYEAYLRRVNHERMPVQIGESIRRPLIAIRLVRGNCKTALFRTIDSRGKSNICLIAFLSSMMKRIFAN